MIVRKNAVLNRTVLLTVTRKGQFVKTTKLWLFIGGNEMLDKLSTFLTLFARRNMEFIVQ